MVVVSLAVVGGLSFYGGLKYGQGKNSSSDFRTSMAGQRQLGGVNGQFRGGTQSTGFVNGEIINKDDKSITVKLRDGGSKIVFYSISTSVGKTVDGTSADLEVGKQVMVTGTASSDGSLTAQNIQIRPNPLTNQVNK